MAPLRLLNRQRPLDADERRLVLRVSEIVAIAVTMIALIPLGIGFLIYQRHADEQFQANAKAIAAAEDANARARALTRRLDSERRDRERAIAQAVFDECTQNEEQDAIFASFLRGWIRIASESPPSKLRNRVLQDWQEQLRAVEPPGEPDCRVPGGSG